MLIRRTNNPILAARSVSVMKSGLIFCLTWLTIALPVMADSITLPAGAVIYGEIQERITSRKHDTFEGDMVEAIVWRDVTVDGQVVIKAGTPMAVRVSRVKRAKMAGIKGQLELRAFSTTALDNTHIPPASCGSRRVREPCRSALLHVQPRSIA